MTPTEVLWEDEETANLWAEDKLIREATHTLIRAHVSQIEAHLTDDYTFEDFSLDDDIIVRPLCRGEFMCRQASGEIAILSADEKTLTTCLSWEAFERDVNILVNVTDRGPTNVCGLHWLMESPIVMLCFLDGSTDSGTASKEQPSERLKENVGKQSLS